MTNPTVFQPPPTYADPVNVDERTNKGQFNPIWLKWFLDLTQYINQNGAGNTIQHNQLAGLQGGQSNQYYHLTQTQFADYLPTTGVLAGTGISVTTGANQVTIASTVVTTGTSILYGNGTGGFSNVTVGTGLSFSGGTLSATGGSGTVTAVTGVAPITSTGGTTPAIGITQATSTTSGYLSSTDWNTFNSKQPAGTYVTSVSVASSNGFAGTSSGGATPALTLSTSVTGVLYGNGTAMSAATASEIVTAIGTTAVTNATNATNLAGGSNFAIPYQSASGTTAFLSPSSTSGYLLVSLAGFSAPTWAAPSSLSVGTATNLAGGSAYALPYQTGSGATSFLSAGTSGQVLVTLGSFGAPAWSSSINLTSGTFGTLYTTGLTGYLYGNGAGAVTASTTIPTSALSGQVSLANGGTNANLTAVAGGVVYSGASALAISAAGTSGQVLTSNGSSAPTWTTPTAYVTVTDDTTTNATRYPLFAAATSGNLSTEYTSSTKYQFNPSTGTLTATVFSGSGASLTSIPNSALNNSSITVGSTAISLGGTATTIAGLTSVTSTSFVGALTGNASTATTATTATNATNVAITDNTSSSSTWYPILSAASTGNNPATTSSTKLSFVPSTGVLSANGVALTGNLGTVTSVAATVPSFLSISGSPITTSGTLAISYSGTALPVANGGTGLTSLTAGYIPYGNGTSALASNSLFNYTNGIFSVGGTTDLGAGISQFYDAVGRWCATFIGQNQGGTYYYALFKTASANVGSITSNGTITVYATTSDRRTKSNIKSITTEQSGPIIDALLPRSYTWNSNNSNDVGFIADELQSVIPNSVIGEPNAVDKNGNPIYQMIDASGPEIIAYLVAELQSIRARLKAANIA